MTALGFQGDYYAAAKHLLASTSLGAELPRVAHVHDDGRFLEVNLRPYAADQLSTGEALLLDFLASLAGSGTVNLWKVLSRVDEGSRRAVVYAVGIAGGEFVPVTPVRFGGAA